MKRIISIFISLLLTAALGLTASASTLDNMPYDSYTYWQEDGSKYLAGSRAMFEVSEILSGDSLGISSFAEAQDITTDKNGKLYILDSASSRVIVLSPEHELSAVFENIGGETFKGAMGITADDNGDIYIADTENKRVIAADKSGGLKKIITCPDSEVIPDDFEFNPVQMTVDKNGYLYVLSSGSFYGALVFSPEGETEGFFGANKVNASVGDILDTLWNRWFMTDEQRASQVQKIPYQFSDLCADETGLLYTTTGALSTYSAQTGQIRCLGPTGTNVMKNRIGRTVTNSDSYNFADEGIAELAVGKRVQDFGSVDVQNGYIYALDRTYGKVYVYNTQCEPLTVFGGGVKKGNQKGTFEGAVALAVSGDKLYVLDSVKGNVTVFKMNDYGAMVQQASALTSTGKYTEAKPLWEQIIKLDRNNQLAYRGLARAALAEKDYSAAMEYARQGLDRGIYDQAFEYVRNDFLEKHLSLIIIGVFLIAALITAAFILKQRGKILSLNAPKASIALSCAVHPFDNFRAVKYKGQGSVLIAAVVLVLYYASGVLRDFYSGFAHSSFNAENYNSLLTLIGTVGVVILWVVCNWLVSVLAEGKGRIKEVFIVACYSLVPQIVSSILYLVLSNVLLLKESAVLTVISTVCMILTGLILCIGTMVIHEFDFFKFLLTAVVTVIAMAIVIFLVFMVIILLQQFFAFIQTVFIEVTYR